MLNRLSIPWSWPSSASVWNGLVLVWRFYLVLRPGKGSHSSLFSFPALGFRALPLGICRLSIFAYRRCKEICSLADGYGLRKLSGVLSAQKKEVLVKKRGGVRENKKEGEGNCRGIGYPFCFFPYWALGWPCALPPWKGVA